MKKESKEQSLIVLNLHASVEGKQILNGISLTVRPAEVHAIMGPNGSGKSTLAYALMGHPGYLVEGPSSAKKSQVLLGKKNLLDVSPEERAKAGLFLAFQSPIAIPGVSVVNLLRTSYQALHTGPVAANVQNPVLARRWTASGMTLPEFMKMVKEYASALKISDEFLARGIHDGFSGGEKKKVEMLQALVLSPKYAIFDEIDTGLDVDALKVVATGISMLKKHGTGVIVITHYQRILKYIAPDVVHILVHGKIVQTGGPDLARQIEDDGYGRFST